jgi:hypothetical protein
MSVQRFLFNIPSDEIEQTAGFYTELFGFEIIFRNADWYIQLALPENTAVQFGVCEVVWCSGTFRVFYHTPSDKNHQISWENR